jgi:hypothetical protein
MSDISTQVKAAQTEIQEILQWLDWTTEVANRIEARLAEIESTTVRGEPDQAVAEPSEPEGPMALMDGIVAYNVTDFQAALDTAGRAFWKRYGKPPVWVALPRGVDPASLKLWTLRVADRPTPAGIVVVGGVTEGGG